jgi:transcriptional regulator with XRE-family HTH domain
MFEYRTLTNGEVRKLKRMKKLRLSMGLSQPQFGRQLGVTKRTVGRWEQVRGHMPAPWTWTRFVQLEKLNTVLQKDKEDRIQPLQYN